MNKENPIYPGMDTVIEKYPKAFCYTPWYRTNHFYIRPHEDSFMNLSGTASRTEARAWEKAAKLITKSNKPHDETSKTRKD